MIVHPITTAPRKIQIPVYMKTPSKCTQTFKLPQPARFSEITQRKILRRSCNYMGSIVKFIGNPKLIFIPILNLLSSCSSYQADSYQNYSYETPWQSHPSGAPIQWREKRFSDGGGMFHWSNVIVRNASSRKLHLVGLHSNDNSANFIDLGQYGAFQLTLYPGDVRTPKGSSGYPYHIELDSKDQFTYLTIQDYALE